MFAAYAILIWCLCFRYRRRWEAVAITFLGLAGVATVGWFHWMLNIWTGGRIYLLLLQGLLYPYGLMLMAVSVYLSLLPRSAAVHAPCRICGYELAGLDDDHGLVCPECGRTAVFVAATLASRCGRCESSLKPRNALIDPRATRVSCPTCKAVHVINAFPDQPPMAIPA